jgi:hypothetical protein
MAYAAGQLTKSKDGGAHWNRQIATAVATLGYPTFVNTLTEPALGANLVLVTTSKGEDLALSFFGTGADNSAYSAKVVGWSSIKGGDGLTVWKPTTLLTLTCTLSTSVGVAGGNQSDSERDADTITVGTPSLPASLYVVQSPANDTPGLVILPSLNFEKVAIYFDITAGATGANVLWKWLGV